MRLVAAASLACALSANVAQADVPNEVPTPAEAPDVIVVVTPAPDEQPAPPPVALPTARRLSPRPPQLTLDATLGFGTPQGWLGGGLSASPINRLSASAGVGLGTRGIQVAGMLHGYPFDLGQMSRLGFGAGVSFGTYASTHFSSLDLRWDHYWKRAVFLNLEASIIAWSKSGLVIEPFAGYGVVLNYADGACAQWRSMCSHVTGEIYLGFKGSYGLWP